MKMLPTFLIAFLLAFTFTGGLSAENWPQFRGPTGQGISTEKNLPLHWGADSNVVWKTEIPGEGWSSPIVWGDRIFVTSATDSGVSCRVLCLDRRSGSILWNTKVFEQVPRRKERKNSYATPTPVTDGRTVFAVFGDGSAVALDFNGAVLWTNREVQFYSRHGLGPSPLLYRDLLIMPFDGSNPLFKPAQGRAGDDERLGWQLPWDQSFIHAYDTKTGKIRWTAKRGQSRIAHVTPNVLKVRGADQIISPAGDVVQGFDPKTGERLWSVYTRGEGVTPSPVFGEGLIFASSGFEAATLRAIRPGAKGVEGEIVWEEKRGTPTQPSLLYVKPHVFALTDGGIATCYRARDGEIIWQERIGGNHSASPIYANGKIYFLSEAGDSVVIAAGPEFKILARNSMGEKCQASFAASQGNLLLRSEQHLYCIGDQQR